MALEEDEPAVVPEWAVTFADMMALLLTFFVMLASLSEVKEQHRYQALVASLRRQFGSHAADDSPFTARLHPRRMQLAKLATQGRNRKFDIMQATATALPARTAAVTEILPTGERTTAGTVLYFERPAEELKGEQQRELQQWALEAPAAQIIEVRGRLPSGAMAGVAYQQGWDRAYEQARSVARYLVHDLGLDAARLRISVAGSDAASARLGMPTPDAGRLRVEVLIADERAGEKNHATR
jgi:chemotaxis protein MotB